MAVYNKFRRIPNIGEVQLWMQHITFKMLPDSISYTEPLCKIVAGEKDVKLWDNDWLKEEFKKDFPQGEICNDKVRDKITPIISIDEVALFDTYQCKYVIFCEKIWNWVKNILILQSQKILRDLGNEV